MAMASLSSIFAAAVVLRRGMLPPADAEKVLMLTGALRALSTLPPPQAPPAPASAASQRGAPGKPPRGSGGVIDLQQFSSPRGGSVRDRARSLERLSASREERGAHVSVSAPLSWVDPSTGARSSRGGGPHSTGGTLGTAATRALIKATGSPPLKPGDHNYLRPGVESPGGPAGGMSLGELERRMTSVVKGVLAGTLPRERLAEVTGVLWDKYAKGPYPSISAIHDARLIALVETGRHHDGVVHYLTNHDVAWSQEGLKAAAWAAQMRKSVDMHAEVLVRLEELGVPIDFAALSRLLETCIAARDTGRIYSLLPRLADSGYPLSMRIYRKMVEAALDDPRAVQLATGGFSAVDAGRNLNVVTSSAGSLQFTGTITERAVLSLRELVRARRAEFGPMHGMRRVGSDEEEGGGLPVHDASRGAGGGGHAVPVKAPAKLSPAESSLMEDRAFGEKALQMCLDHEDVHGGTLAYHVCRELQVKELTRFEPQMKRLRTAAHMGAPALAEAIVADMLFGKPLLGAAAKRAIDGLSSGHATSGSFQEGAEGDGKSGRSQQHDRMLAYDDAFPEDGGFVPPPEAVSRAGRIATLTGSSARHGRVGRGHGEGTSAHSDSSRSLLGNPRALSSALNYLTQAYAKAGDAVGVSRGLALLHELRTRWLKTLCHQAMGEGGPEADGRMEVDVEEVLRAIDAPTSHDPQERDAVAAGREAAEYIAAIQDAQLLAPGKGCNVGVTSETAAVASSALLQAMLKLLHWEKTLKKQAAKRAAQEALASEEDAEAGGSAHLEEGSAEGGAPGGGDEPSPLEEQQVATPQSISALYQTDPSLALDGTGVAAAGGSGGSNEDLAASAAGLLAVETAAATASVPGGAGGRGKLRRPFVTQPLLVSYGLAATLVGLQPESSTPDGFPRPQPPSLPPGSPGWPFDTEPLRQGRLDGLAALAAGYSLPSWGTRLVSLGAAEAWAMLHGRLPFPVGGPTPSHAAQEEEEEAGAPPPPVVDMEVASAAHRALFRPGGPAHGVGSFGLGRDSPWSRTLLAGVTEANTRMFASTSAGGGGGGGGGTEGTSTDAGGAPPDLASSLAAANIDVLSMTLTSQFASIHGGASAPLPDGNHSVFDVMKASLGLPTDRTVELEKDFAKRPSIPPTALSALLNAMATSQARAVTSPLLNFATRVLGGQADADAYAALLAAHANWTRDTLDVTTGTEVIRALRAAGLSPNGAVYGELSYLLARLGRDEQAVATLLSGLRTAQALAGRVVGGRARFARSNRELYAAHRAAAASAPAVEGASLHADLCDEEEHVAGEEGEGEGGGGEPRADLPPPRGVTGVTPSPLPCQSHFERVVRILMRRLPGKDAWAADMMKPDWWDPPAGGRRSGAAHPGEAGQLPSPPSGSGTDKDGRPLWRAALSLMTEAGYSPTPVLKYAVKDHLGFDLDEEARRAAARDRAAAGAAGGVHPSSAQRRRQVA